MKYSIQIKTALRISLGLATILLVIYWFAHTPSGSIGKLHAIGYSVCHQTPSHSLKIGNQTFPLCSRCLGLYLGNIIGLLVLFKQGKKSGIPAKKYMAIYAFFVIAWLVDGGNSYLNGLLGHAPLYPPNNTLRLITGLGMGLSMSTAIVILFNLVTWQKKEKVSPIRFFPPLLLILFIAAILVPVILVENEILMTIFAYLSTGMIVIVLTALYTIVWIIFLQKENSFNHTKEMVLILNAGFFCALMQITLLDAVRFALTGTWASFSFY